MPVRRISPAVLAYGAIALVQLLAGLLVSGGGVSAVGAAVALGLFVFLFRGEPVAWGVLVALNTLGLVGVLVGVLTVRAPSHPVWSHVAILAATGLAAEAVLLSGAMRVHVRSRGLRLAPIASARRRGPGRSFSSRVAGVRAGRRSGSAAAPGGPGGR